MTNRNRRTRLSSSAAKAQQGREPKDWRDASSGSGRRATVGRRTLVAKWLLLCLTLLVLTTLFAILGAILFRRHYAVPMLVFAVLDYDAPLPPNAWADEDAKLLEDAWVGTTRFGVRDRAIRVAREGKSHWSNGERFLEDVARELKTVTPGGPGRDVVLLYLSAHGVLDDADEPVLLLERFEPRTDTALRIGALPPGVKVAELLRTLEQSRPAKAKMVLFLDAGKIGSNWQLGLLHNRFAEKLPEVVKEAKVPNLVVVNSAGAGQVGWCFPDWGCSAFGLAVCHALKGSADISPADGMVTLNELRDYLLQELPARVHDKNAAPQVPLFLGTSEDFPLAFADNVRQAQPARAEVASANTRQQLDRLWLTHHELSPWTSKPDAPSLPRRDWFRFEAFQQGLIRLEELYQAGGYYASEAASLQAKLENLARQLTRKPEVRDDPTAPSLPLALQLPPGRRDAVWNLVRKHWPESVEDAEPLSNVTPDELASVVMDSLLEESDGVRREMIDRALNLVQTRIEPDSARAVSELVEMRNLRSFRQAGHLPDSSSGQARILQTALQTRQDAESAASAPRDREILALDAVRVLVDRGDQHRRQAEDFLFVGAYEAADGLLKQARMRYRQARDAELNLHQVLLTRDRIWMEVPYLLQWAAGSRDEGGIQTHSTKRVQTCFELLQDAVTLDRELYGPMEQWRIQGHSWTDSELDELGRQINGELLVQSERLAQRLDELHRGLDDDVQATIRTVGVSKLARIPNLVRTPLVTGAARQKLLESCADAYLASSSADAMFWREHPEFSHPAALLMERSSKLQEEKDPWGLRSQAARDAGAAVTLFALAGVEQPETLLGNPWGQLEEFYQAEFWCWQAQRFSEDFYGDDGSPRGDRPYFARVAQSCLDRADRYHEVPGIQAASNLLDERIAAARDWQSGSWIGITAEDGSSSDKVPLQLQAKNRGVIQPTLRWQVPKDLPAGLAALFLDDLDRQRVPLATKASTASSDKLPRVLEFAVPATQLTGEAQTLISPVLGADALPGRSNWTFGLFYRGHLAQCQFEVEIPEVGQVVHVRSRPQANPQVQVVWNPNPASIAFCLDCSWSMKQRTRMEKARRTLVELLDDLERYPDFSVSLWLFGHRRYVSDNTPYKLTWNPDWEKLTGQSEDASVTFENDLQLIWRRNAEWLSNLHLPSLKNVGGEPSWSKWLRGEQPIVPFGFTPLHRVMETAIKDHLGMAEPETTRRLIVLSDGRHEVWKSERPAGLPPYDPREDRTAEDVGNVLVAKNRNAVKPIRVLIIGDVSAGKDLEGLEGTKNIINKTAGDVCDFVETEFDNQAAHGAVRRSLGLYLWSVFSADSPQPLEPTPLVRNAVFPIAQTAWPHGRYTVRLHYGNPREPEATAMLAVEGDEAFRLEVRQDDDAPPRLVHQRYRRGSETDEIRASAIVNSGSGASRDEDFNPKAFFVAAHPPERSLERTAWRFPISIQNADQERFSPRAVEFWAEITPLRRRGGTTEPSGRPFVFYDPVWEAKQPVPVLLLEADPWPPEADAADVRLWFKLEDSPYVEQTLSRIRGEREGDFQWRLDEHQVEFAVAYTRFQDGNRRGCKVVVLEHLLSESDDAPESPAPGTRFKVQLSEPATEIQREFFPELGRVRHVFRYDNVDETAVGAYRLRITPVEAIRKHAADFKIPQPLSIPR